MHNEPKDETRLTSARILPNPMLPAGLRPVLLCQPNEPVFEASHCAVGCFNFCVLGQMKCFFSAGKVKALLQG